MGKNMFGVEGVSSKTLTEAQDMPMPRGVFFVKPDFFEIDHAINPHMLDVNGNPHTIDRGAALEQWRVLAHTYEGLGFETQIFTGESGCPDMVFCANQSFPYLDENQAPASLLCNMEDDRRQREVASIGASLTSFGIKVKSLPERSKETLFEGMGDALWVPGKRFILGGHGYRTHPKMYQYLYEKVRAPIVTFALKNPKFYHLDTCLSILDEKTALACREAFTDDDWQVLDSLFINLITVPVDEADSPGFACNAHCPDRKHVIIQSGNIVTEAKLAEAGFVAIPVETGEFIKSGGSVFCMKQIFF